MSDDKLLPPAHSNGGHVPQTTAEAQGIPASYADDPFFNPYEAEEGGVDVRR